MLIAETFSTICRAFLRRPLGHIASEEAHRMFRDELDEELRVREDARNLTLLEWAKELLLDEDGR